jgi:O-antigen/teichoic acid export membrane protein
LGIQSIAGLLLNYLLIKRELFYFRNITSNIKAESSNLFSAGGMFFLLQIGVMISSSADNLIISSQLGAERVATFAIVVKLFQFATQPIGIMNAPLWGAYADAYAKGETQYIKKTLRKSISITSVYSTVVVIILVVGGGRIISMWTNEKIEVSLGLLIACGGWAILESVGSAFAMFLNGCGIIRQQVITAVVFSGIAIAVKLFLIQACGLQAMVVGAALTYLIVTILAYGLIFRDKLVETLA